MQIMVKRVAYREMLLESTDLTRARRRALCRQALVNDVLSDLLWGEQRP